MVNLVGLRLEKYQLDRLLGSGGVSTVYLAHNVETGQRCAVKVLLPHLAEDRELAKRFRDGGYLTAGLQHPNIVRVYRVGEDQGYSFIAMEQLSGGTLTRRLKGRRWPLPQAIALLGQVAAGLDYVH
jgi:serine/threonine-protein kinase